MSPERGHGRIRSVAAAFIRMDFIEEISYPMSFALDQLGIAVPVFIWFFVSQLVPPSERVGGDYFTFAVIGLSVAAILQASLSGFGGSLQRTQNRGTLETLLVEPVPWVFLPFAMNLWRMCLAVFSGAVMLAIAGLLGAQYRLDGIPEFLLLVVLAILATTAVGVLAASLLILAKRSTPVLVVYGLASSLLAGALFPVELLPSWLRIFSWVIPHTYAINAGRQVLMAEPGTSAIPISTAVLALLVFNVVVLSLGLWLFSRSMQYARKLGILGGY